MDDHEFGAKIKALRDDTGAMREFLRQPGHLARLYDLAIKGAGKKPAKHKNRTALPDGLPDQVMKDAARSFWALRKRRDLMNDVDHQAQAFRDHHLGKGTLAADWAATWRTWMTNALRFSPKHPADSLNYPEAVETLAVWKERLRLFRDGDTDDRVAPGYWKDAWGPKPGEPGCRAPQ